MHPNRAFAMGDVAAMRAFVAARGFAHLFAATPDGPMVAHAPLTVTAAGTLRFHLARGNRLFRHLDGVAVLASVAGPDAYVSPDWYGAADQVPTWNYVAVEAEGVCRRLDETALIDQLDTLSAVHEATLAPKPPWMRDKMSPGRFAAMLPAIACFELMIDTWRGTTKLSQNKPTAQRAGAAAGLRAAGRDEIAALMAG